MSVLCEICERNINSDEVSSDDIFSSDEHDIICFDCNQTRSPCRGCSTSTPDNDLRLNGRDKICEDCHRGANSCDNCGMALVGSYHEHYCNFNSEHYCHDCLDEAEAYTCEDCSDTVSVYFVIEYEGHECIDEYRCESCYEQRNRSEYLGGEVFSTARKYHNEQTNKIDKSVFDSCYVHTPRVTPPEDCSEAELREYEAWSSFMNVWREYYTQFSHLDHKRMFIKKGAFGYGDYGTFESEIEVESTLVSKVYRMLDYLILESVDSLHRPHKKWGIIQPFAEMFAPICHFFIKTKPFTEEGRERVKNVYPYEQITEYKQLWMDAMSECKSDSQRIDVFSRLQRKYGNPHLSFYVDHLERDVLRRCVKTNKLPDGRPLIRNVHRLIERLERTKDENERGMNGVWNIVASYKDSWNKYMTNNANVKLRVTIGYEPNAHETVQKFNESNGSCQSHSYIQTLGFNHISMQVNPHLFLLIYDENNPDKIIGRCVVRLMYRRVADSIDKSKLWIVPSRLYLNEHTQAKADIYLSVYQVLDRWKDECAHNFEGGDNAVLGCYTKSKHEDVSIYTIIGRQNTNNLLKLNYHGDMNIASEKYYPVWIEKPDSECLWTYYNDEYQRSDAFGVNGSEFSSFAVRETYSGDFVEVEINK